MTEDNKAIKTDKSHLYDDLVRLFYANFSEVLDILSSRFPHKKGDNSINEQEFNGLRAKVLRSGNNKLRKLPDILDNYDVVQTHETVVEEPIKVNTPVKQRVQVNTPVAIPDGKVGEVKDEINKDKE